MHPAFLDYAGRNLLQAQGTREWQKVHTQPRHMTLNLLGIAPAFGDGLIFSLKLFGCISKRLFHQGQAKLRFATLSQIPVFRKLFCKRQTLNPSVRALARAIE